MNQASLDKEINVAQKIDFKSVFESVPGLYLLLLPDLVIDGVSEEYLYATMTTREAIMGRHLFDIFPDNPNDSTADGVSNLRTSLDTVLLTGAPHTMAVQKYDIRRPDGTFEERYWSPLNKPVLNTKGEVDYIIHSVVDVTRRVHDERKLLKAAKDIKELYDKAPCGYISVDANMLVSSINETLLKWLGYSLDEVVGKMEYAELLTPDSHIEHLKAYKELYAEYIKNGSVNGLDREFKRKDGTTFPALVNSAAVMGDKGNFIKSSSTVFDNSKQKQAEEQLRNANTELESFSYSVSHDLRAPLRGINGFIKILIEDYGPQLDTEAMRLMNIILANANKMAQLIDDLLAFSRLGRKELSKTNVQMENKVIKVCEELKAETHDRQIDFKVHHLPTIKADDFLVRQVWVNLISNAIKYTKFKEHALIQIGYEQNSREVIFSIKDNGAGFDMQYADKLFGVFQRLHSIEEFEGTGVGLAIVYRIISKHGGRIWAKGKKDEGATFYFSLPK